MRYNFNGIKNLPNSEFRNWNFDFHYEGNLAITMSVESRSMAAPASRSWSSVASLNIARRNKTNTIEVRLENEESRGCTLNVEEIQRLLQRLKIKASDFTSVQACPERKNIVFITFRDGIDISKFIQHGNESCVLKEGVRTTTIKQASNRDVYVKIFGLHPDTRDEVVIRYLNAHGKVNPQAPVRYGVYGGDPSTNLLAGKRNGDRIYTMQVHKNLGSTHIIDGERVSIKYPGQLRTCNKCHQPSSSCPGKGLAKDCSAEKVLLSDFMVAYWQSIGFFPETEEMNEVDIDNPEILQQENINKDDFEHFISCPRIHISYEGEQGTKP